MKRNYIILICFYLNTINLAYSQIEADAGPDIRYCDEQFNLDSIQLGGNPTAIGGVPIYKYIWSCTNKVGLRTYHASDYLMDTTVSNPKFKQKVDGVTFKLMVIDGNGDFDFDEVNVRGSYFMNNTGEKIINIVKGQSARLYYSIGGGFEPYTYFWEPNYNISSQFEANPMVWPDTSLRYYLTITDAVGCVSGKTDFVTINIYPTSLEEDIRKKKNIDISPNPMIDKSILRFNKELKLNSKLEFINNLGCTVKTINIISLNDIEIIKSDFESGFYYLMIVDNGQRNLVGKLLVN
jgi:hypothetical protein